MATTVKSHSRSVKGKGNTSVKRHSRIAKHSKVGSQAYKVKKKLAGNKPKALREEMATAKNPLMSKIFISDLTKNLGSKKAKMKTLRQSIRQGENSNRGGSLGAPGSPFSKSHDLQGRYKVTGVKAKPTKKK